MRDAMMGRLGELRYEPTEKRIRVLIGDDVLVDTTRADAGVGAAPGRPSYAVPMDALRGELAADDETTMDAERLLHPGIPFSVHSTPGRSFTVRMGGATVRRPRSGPTTRISQTMWCSTSRPSTAGSRRTTRWCRTRATRTTGWTYGRVRGTCGSN